jgi:UDP-N-acetylglucosamine transferase subunit ALG13
LIFVTVGTHNQSFERLVKKADEIAGKIGEKMIIQTGHTKYKPKNAESFDFASREKMEQLNKEARIVISHGGAGSIIFALQFRKPLIVVPRLKKFDEHVNDHQLELAKELEREGRIIGVYDIEELEKAIASAEKLPPREYEEPPMVKLIRDYLSGVAQ